MNFAKDNKYHSAIMKYSDFTASKYFLVVKNVADIFD